MVVFGLECPIKVCESWVAYRNRMCETRDGISLIGAFGVESFIDTHGYKADFPW